MPRERGRDRESVDQAQDVDVPILLESKKEADAKSKQRSDALRAKLEQRRSKVKEG